jgi:hypothetical protein
MQKKDWSVKQTSPYIFRRIISLRVNQLCKYNYLAMGLSHDCKCEHHQSGRRRMFREHNPFQLRYINHCRKIQGRSVCLGLWQIADSDLMAYNEYGKKPQVVIEEQQL